MRVIYADLPCGARLIVIDDDTVVVSSDLRDIAEQRAPHWSLARLRAALGLDLDDRAYPAPTEPESEVCARLPRRRTPQLGPDE